MYIYIYFVNLLVCIINCTRCTVHTSKSLSNSSFKFQFILYNCFNNYSCYSYMKNSSFQITVNLCTDRNQYKMNCKYFATRQEYCSNWVFCPPNTTFFLYSYCIIASTLIVSHRKKIKCGNILLPTNVLLFNIRV